MLYAILSMCKLAGVLKVFRTRFSYGPVTRVMKLDQRKIHWIIRQKQKGVTTKQIAQDMKISRRRVQQIWKSYAESKQEPVIGENMGRPRKPFDEREAQVVGEGYRLYRFGARMLEVAARNVLRFASPITAFTCISKQRTWLMKIRRNRSDASGFGTSASIACPQDISIGMNQVGQISRFALSLMTHPG